MTSVSSQKITAAEHCRIVFVSAIIALLLIASCSLAWGQAAVGDGAGYVPASTPTDSVATGVNQTPVRSGGDIVPISITDLLAKLALVALQGEVHVPHAGAEEARDLSEDPHRR